MSAPLTRRLQALEQEREERRAAEAVWRDRLAEALGTDVDDLEERAATFSREARDRGLSERDLVRERMRERVKVWRADGETLEDMLGRTLCLVEKGFPDETIRFYREVIRDGLEALEADEKNAVITSSGTSQSSERKTGANGEKHSALTKPPRRRVRVL